MRLLLVRHGQTRSNVAMVLDTMHPGAGLDETGLEQAQALVERLAELPIDAIYVSDLPRTAQTATPLAVLRGLELTVLPGLREIQAGEDEMSPDWLRYVSTLRAWWEGDPGAKIPGGEDAHQFLERFDAAIDQIVLAGHDHVVVVSHGAALRVWTEHRIPGFNALVGHQGLPNTTVIVAEGHPETGWSLVSVDFPDASGSPLR
ncbi:MAG: histidine phosphatase family protein [Micropruina sp.]